MASTITASNPDGSVMCVLEFIFHVIFPRCWPTLPKKQNSASPRAPWQVHNKSSEWRQSAQIEISGLGKCPRAANLCASLRLGGAADRSPSVPGHHSGPSGCFSESFLVQQLTATFLIPSVTSCSKQLPYHLLAFLLWPCMQWSPSRFQDSLS